VRTEKTVRRLGACIAAALGSALFHSTAHAVPSVALNQVRHLIEPIVATASAVTNCIDSTGSGTLRSAIASAATGDVIDLSQLGCTGIRLNPALGQLNVAVLNLAIIRETKPLFSINGDRHSRLIQHTVNNGSLTLIGMDLYGGFSHEDKGGCIYSSGTVALQHSQMSDCFVEPNGNAVARGGAIYATQVTMIASSITSATAQNQSNIAVGGAINAALVEMLSDPAIPGSGSMIANSHAYGGTGSSGGAIVATVANIRDSTISGCKSVSVGAVDTGNVKFVNSTISGNTATDQLGVGGVFARYGGYIQNSTLAFNSAPKYGALRVGAEKITVLGSSIFTGSTNSQGQIVTDVSQVSQQNPPPQMVIGSGNVVQQASVTMPPDTVFADPKLSVLGNFCGNNAAPHVHTLLPGSPAFHHGGIESDEASVDQCGHSRGDGDQVDSGAIQVSLVDDIFSDDFEGVRVSAVPDRSPPRP
jgi:hypothetical protein